MANQTDIKKVHRINYGITVYLGRELTDTEKNNNAVIITRERVSSTWGDYYIHTWDKDSLGKKKPTINQLEQLVTQQEADDYITRKNLIHDKKSELTREEYQTKENNAIEELKTEGKLTENGSLKK